MVLQPESLYLKLKTERIFEIKKLFETLKLTDYVQTVVCGNYLYVKSIKPISWKYLANNASRIDDLTNSFQFDEGMLYFSEDYGLFGYGLYEFHNIEDN